jgi:hypothetical protein
MIMKPGDHPDFFRSPAPEGRSRESTIVLDGAGRFWHDGRPVEHAGLAAALHSWIGRHPDNGRYILTNGYDWTYFTVEDAPYVVRAVRLEDSRILLVLSDGTEEPWDPSASHIGKGGALYAVVKRGARHGPYEAKFTRHAQASLEPVLVDEGGRDDGGSDEGVPAVRIGSNSYPIGAKRAGFG